MKTYLLAILFLIISSELFSQDGPKVVVFNTSENAKDSEPSYYNNLIKLSILEAFSGDIAFYYERIIKPNMSAEVGLGLTVSDYLTIMLDNLEETANNLASDRTAKIGTSFALGFRYYPFKASEEFYFAPEFKFRYYHNTFTPYNTTTLLPLYSSPLLESKTSSNMRITVGYMYFIDKNIFVDMYGGLGLNNVKRKSYSSVYNQTTDAFDYQFSNDNSIKPRLTLGLKFGFVF